MKQARRAAIGFLAGLLIHQAASALEFGSTARAAILYDAPAKTAVKLAVVSAAYPLEKLISANGWVKVRDASGALGWMDETDLGTKRTALVNVPVCAISEKPIDNAPVRFRAQQGVVLDLISQVEGGWIKVRHASGQEGYAKIRELWGL